MKKSLRHSSRNFANSDSPFLIKLLVIVFLLITTTANAGNYTWNGATSTNWATSSNWSPAGVPSTNDTVTLSNGGVNSILLDGNRTITRLVISANSINLNTYELHVSGRSSLNGGAINNGNLKIRGTYAYFQGTNFNCTLDVIAGQIKFSGGTFDQTGSFEQNGSASGYGLGGCTFNKDVTIKNTGTVYLRMGETSGDTFNGKLYLYNSGGYSVQMAYGDTSYFNDTIYVNSTGSGGINFANGTYGASILGDSACFITGSSGISAGTIQFKNINQSATSKNSITATGSVLFNVYSNSFGGKVNFTAPNLVVKSTTFSDSTSLTKTGSTLTNTWEGANTYHSVATITNGNTGTAILKLASQNGDVYYKDVYFNAGSGPIQAASVGVNTYNGNVIANGNAVTFSTNGGTFKFTGSENQTFGGGTSTLNFNKIIVDKTSGDVTLNQPITIDSLLQLTNGILYTDTIITLKATATTTGASNVSFVDGTVKKIGNSAFVFPVGDEGQWNPIEITAPSVSTDAFIGQYYAIHHTLSDSSDTTISSLSTCNYWRLQRITGTSNVQVKLNWDSLGCGLFDTIGVHVANWDGAKWRDLGSSSKQGDASSGSVVSSVTVAQYNYFTLGISLPIIAVNPTLGTDRSLPTDFFGFNGSNTINVDASGNSLQTWEELFTNNVVLASRGSTLLRIPAGTLSNFSDWRTGWPIIERDLPFDWFYDKSSYKRIPNDITGNTQNFIRDNLQLLGAQAIIAWNVLSSKFYYELASTYYFQELNTPIRYIELGNEFYLSDEFYKEIFPSPNSYVDRALEYATNFRNLGLPQTTDDFTTTTIDERTKIAMVGADLPSSGSGRKRMWLESTLKRLPNTDNIDAIVVHDYIGESKSSDAGCIGNFRNDKLYEYLSIAFVEEDYLKNNTFNLIDNYNTSKFSSKPLEIWLTEFNMLDTKNNRVGTWSHGLFNAIMALKYLETESITKVVSHTLTSDGTFGNIFESADGFGDITCKGAPLIPNDPIITVQWDLTAVGNALDQLAKGMQDAVNAYPLDFSSTAAQSQTLDGINPFLYGWVFERQSGDRELVLLNLGGNQSYQLELNTIFPSTVASALEFEQLTSNGQKYAITGNAQLNSTALDKLKLITATASSNLLSGLNPFVVISPFSITRIYLNSPALRVRLTDNEICSGTSTSLVIEGGTMPYTLTCASPDISFSQMAGNPHIWEVSASSNISATNDYEIKENGIVVCTLKVHNDLTDLVILTSSNTTFVSPTTFCYDPESSPSLTMNAFFEPGHNGITGNTGDHHFLWAPDSGMVSNGCSTNTPMCSSITVAPDRTTEYTVYVNDDHCWKSASVIIEVPVEKFELSDDINVCAGTDVVLTSNYPDDPDNSASYMWSTSQSIGDITIAYGSLSLGANNITLTVTDGGCSRSDEITVNVLSCCSGDISLTPQKVGNRYITQASDIVDQVSASCPNCIIPIFNGTDIIQITIDANGNGGTSLGKTIYLNGDFVLRAGSSPTLDTYDLILINCTLKLGENASINIDPDRILTLENCSLSACGNSMWQGIILDKKGSKFTPSVNISDCIIKDAKSAVFLTRDANYKITNTLFENCYIDIKMSKFQAAVANGANAIYGKIEGNTFTSSATLLSPYNTEIKYAGIVMDDVEDITIGKAGGSLNEFENSLYGVHMKNSSLKLLNNSFHDLWDSPTTPTIGAGVYVLSDFDQNDRLLKVGNGSSVTTTYGINLFKRTMNGIYVEGEMNLEIKKNYFGNDTTADRITNYGIGIKKPGYKSIIIENKNEFYDYTYGIWLQNNMDYKELLVNDNEFFNHFATTVPPTSNRHYYGTAISAVNDVPTIMSNAEISENIIGTSSANSQPRIGIRLANMQRVKVYENEINFNFSSPPTEYYTGISLVESNYARLNLNRVINNNTLFPTGSNEFLKGLDVARSTNLCIERCTLNNLGIGMYFTGTCIVNSLFNNTFANYDTAIYLNDADIGALQGRESPDYVLSNNWSRANTDPNTALERRVEGIIKNGGQIKWYYQTSTNNEFYPTSLNPSIIQSSLSSPSSISLCPPLFRFAIEEDPHFTAEERNAIFGYVVGDSARYNEHYSEEMRLISRYDLYLTLKNNPEILDLDDEADESFSEFYGDLQEENIAIFDSVGSLTENGLYELALELVSTINDTTSIDYNLKECYSIYLNATINDTVFSSSDSSILQEIAYMNPLVGGQGVLMARVLLNLEIYDEPISGARIRNVTSADSSKILFEVFPIPTHQLLSIKTNANTENAHLRIHSIDGRILRNFNYQNYVDVTDLSEGVYFLTLKSESESVTVKFVKN